MPVEREQVIGVPFTLHRLQREVGEWSRRNFGDQPIHRPLLGAFEEVGELAHAHLKEEQGIRSEEDHVANGKDAVADVVIYLADYCARRGWSLGDIVESTWRDVVSKRDWTDETGAG